MSNDENKSLQQNLPLSWEEDSQNNLEEQAPPKKLLLRREEPETDTFQDEFEAEAVDKPQAPKPLLLKKAAEEPEAEYRKVQDNLDTIYDKQIPTESDEADEYNEEDWEDDTELDSEDIIEESSELENETDSFGVTENLEDDDDSDDDSEELDSLDDDLESNDSEEDDDDSDDESDDDSEELGSLDDDQENNDSEEDDDDSDDEYASAFEDSGTFTLDEKSDDVESPKTPLFEEDDIDSNRIEIPEGSFSSVSSADEELEEEPALTPEESIFALKADTFYEVQTEEKSDIEPIENPEPTEVIQDYDVQTLGSLLQEARLSCSFTIKDAAEATRIKSSYIIALENNEMEELPAKVYVLNYIRQLCREYNVPNEPIITAFERQSESPSNGGDVKIIRVGDEDARKATKPKSKLNALLVGTSILVFLMLFLIGWYMKWFNPVETADTIKIEVNLEDVRPEVKLPAPELPIPSQ
ncbi:MAG: helix-turn-helix domain-containing protein [Lentisphaeraceae bacterium]|nr:helix-turn-helix domain-containing protein [Lentisphaeraceae bacterium]